MNKPSKLTYNINLDTILAEKGISRYKLSKDTGITRKTLREIGKRDTRISTLIQICTYLNIELNELITAPNVSQ